MMLDSNDTLISTFFNIDREIKLALMLETCSTLFNAKVFLDASFRKTFHSPKTEAV